MATFYVDSSVLVKQHIEERGTAWTRATLDATQHHHIAVSRLSEIEVVAAFARRQREGTLPASALARVEAAFQRLGASVYTWVELEPSVRARAQALVRLHPLRTLDALHLASALGANTLLVAAGLPALTFLAADERLLAAARAEGLATDNPQNHP
jgi:predicted nucleic acid-binding protein